MTRIAAHPTLFDGIVFRSKLEAQWANVFSLLGIEYLYEPQGYLLNPRWCPRSAKWMRGFGANDITSADETRGRAYLPDFYLPGLDAWAEVKGSHAHLDYRLMAWAAMCLPEAPTATSSRNASYEPVGLDLDGEPIWVLDPYRVKPLNTTRLLILGPVPYESSDAWDFPLLESTGFDFDGTLDVVRLSLPETHWQHGGKRRGWGCHWDSVPGYEGWGSGFVCFPSDPPDAQPTMNRNPFLPWITSDPELHRSTYESEYLAPICRQVAHTRYESADYVERDKRPLVKVPIRQFVLDKIAVEWAAKACVSP